MAVNVHLTIQLNFSHSCIGNTRTKTITNEVLELSNKNHGT